MPDVGTMYRALARMLDNGLIEAAARRPAPDADDERRNYYRITDAGRRAARAEARRLEALTRAARLGGLLAKERNQKRSPGERVRALVPAAPRLYPPDFRDDMGEAVVEAYRDRAREALRVAASCGSRCLAARARGLAAQRTRRADAARGVVAAQRQLGPRHRDRDAPAAARPAFVAATVGTLTLGLGMFAVVYTVVHKVLIEPMPYRNPDDLYFVWRDYGPIIDLKRGALAGPDIAELQKPTPSSRTPRAPAVSRRDFRAARGRRPDRDRGDGHHAEAVRAPRRGAHARARLRRERSRSRAPGADRADARAVESARRRSRDRRPQVRLQGNRTRSSV